MKNKERFAGILIFITLFLSVIYFSFFNQNEVKNIVKFVEIKGTAYLTGEQYLSFSKLDIIKEPENLNLSIIKDRIEKHPYVKKADVRFINQNTVEIKIEEKKIDALLLTEKKQFYVSENFELLPVLTVKFIDIPVITNPVIQDEKLKVYELANSNDIKTAFKVIETTKLVSDAIYSNLSEVNLRKGKDIILSFSGYGFPVIFGRGNEVNKIVCFEKIWDRLNKKTADSMINYIDLRFAKSVYIGTERSVNEEKGISS